MAPKRKHVAREAPPKPTCYELRERTAQGKVVKVNKRFPPSLQDPFHVLGDLEVWEIISHLEARDTETLRRVSRLWKASSEYHCDRSLLLQHFPWMATEISESTTRVELNLLFRRCLYQQESLKAGLATRAIKFSGAHEWHIRGASVVWSNLQESVSIRVLSSSKASSSSKSETTRLKVQKLVPKSYNIKFVQSISEDEILVTAWTKSQPWSENPRPEKLILISLSGETKWIANVENPFIRPAIGRASLYLISCRMATDYTRPRDGKMTFMKLSLSTGSIEMSKSLPITNEHYGFYSNSFSSNESLVLSMDEKYAMWVDRYSWDPYSGTASHNIVCTTTGSLVYSYKNDRHPLAFMATSSITKNAVWAYGFPDTMLTQQNPYDKSWATCCIHLQNSYHVCYSREEMTTVQLGFEGDRFLFSHLIHSKLSEIENQEGLWPPDTPRYHHPPVRRTSKFGVSTAVTGTEVLMVDEITGTPFMPSTLYTPSTPSVVTLPNGGRGRRELEVKLPWTGYSSDFFGFVEGFVVYHHKQDAILLLIDFRPRW